MTVRSAGHPPPLLLDGRQAREMATEQGPPIGVFDEVVWPAVPTHLPDPWTVVLYTDGLIEGRDEAGRWGVEGLAAVAPHLFPAAAPDPLAGLVQALTAEAVHRNGGPLPDDVAILALSSLTP
jgi:serine phosphatase RsbU (regulator of sigma subunit)